MVLKLGFKRGAARRIRVEHIVGNVAVRPANKQIESQFSQGY